MCVYKKKREHSDCLPALRIYDTIFIKSLYIAECFMNSRHGSQSNHFVVSLFPCLLLSLFCMCSAVACVLWHDCQLAPFHSHSWRKRAFLSRSSTFVRRFFIFFLLFSEDWKYGQKYTRVTYTALQIPFFFSSFLSFLMDSCSFTSHVIVSSFSRLCVCVCICNCCVTSSSLRKIKNFFLSENKKY